MSLGQSVKDRVEALVGARVVGVRALAGGCVAEVYRVDFERAESVVIKVDQSSRPRLDVEGFMLAEIARRSTLRVPRVIGLDPDLLVMEFIASDGSKSDLGCEEFARAMAGLHRVQAEAYGFARATLIGPLEQPNVETDDWSMFFGEYRLRHFADSARQNGSLPEVLHLRCLTLAERLSDELCGAEAPVLIHGDCWSGNVLWNAGRFAGVIDPALYHADREVELAFMDLMGSFGGSFWAEYESLLPVRGGFWERRRLIYQLYPLLVHVQLFGGGYVRSVAEHLDALGV